jgi:hypothetical protein
MFSRAKRIFGGKLLNSSDSESKVSAPLEKPDLAPGFLEM